MERLPDYPPEYDQPEWDDAETALKWLANRVTKCCGKMYDDHAYFHSEEWTCSAGDDPLNRVTVDAAVKIYRDCATTYWIFDGGRHTEVQDYGEEISYPEDHETWDDWYEKLNKQLEGAAKAAWCSDVLSCPSCGDHYHAPDGPCCPRRGTRRLSVRELARLHSPVRSRWDSY